MDAPKCPLCGKREWGHVCGPAPAKAASPEPHKKYLEPHHAAWLSAHPERTEAWLAERIRDGFCIHHRDGNQENDDPLNVILIESKDHHLIHGHRLVGDMKGNASKFAKLNASARVKRWRAANRKRYNAQMRAYMRDWRKRAKDGSG